MLSNFEEHGFRVTAEEYPDACTACPFWMVDTREFETGICLITGTEIAIDGPQDKERMSDCVIISEAEIKHRIERELRKQEREAAIRRNWMIIQRITGVVIALITIGAWYLLDMIEYAPVMLPPIAASIWMILTDKCLEE